MTRLINSSTETAQPGRRRKAGAGVWPRVLIGLTVIAVLLVAAATTLYLNRRAVTQHILVSWFEQRGIAAEVLVDRIDWTGVVGSASLGDQANPDVAVERVQIGYAIGLPWSATGLGITLRHVHLLRPVVNASWREGRISLGALDPLVQEFAGRPAATATRGPAVVVEAGRLQLDSGHGPLQLLGDARIDDGRLMHLVARMPAVSIGNIEENHALGLAATLELTTSGERVAMHIEATAESFSAARIDGEDAQLTVTGNLPYPDLATQTVDGALQLQSNLDAATLTTDAGHARTVQIQAAFDGEAAGGTPAFRASGQGDLDLAAAAVEGMAISAEVLHAALDNARLALEHNADGLAWSLQSAATAGASQLNSGEISLQRLRTALNLDLAGGGTQGDATRLHADGSVEATGRWPLLGAPAADDLPEMKEMKRALQAFSIRVPGLRLSASSTGTTAVLTQPARLVPVNGGALEITPLARPVYHAAPGEAGGGALRLVATRGLGLPAATITIPDWRFTETGFEARLDGRAALDFDLARGIQIRTRGVLALKADQLSYAASDCVALTVERLQLEQNQVTGISGALCPDGAPLFAAADGAWQMHAGFKGVAGEAAFAAIRFADFQGQVTAKSAVEGMDLQAEVASGEVSDTTVPARFNPLTTSGSAAFMGGQGSGVFALAAGDRQLGQITLAHDAQRQAGGLRIDVPELVFAAAGLQPDQLSPLASDFVQSPVIGSIRFEGWIDWAGEDGSSGGRLVIPDLDFASPAGAVQGLKGQIEFTSLMPLTTAPAQSLSVDRLVAATEATGLSLVFALDAGALRVAGGELSAAGGRILATPFAIPLDLTQPFSGTVVLENLQLGKLIADTGFVDKFVLDAVVSGRMPFVWTPGQGLRIVGGALAAVQPGRFTLRREVLAEVQTSAGAQVPSGTVEDLAYQALENLAFDVLSAEVNSLDGGRIGMVFRVKGRHDPPQQQDLRVGIAELISRRFLQRSLPLPSNTGIDLTLDTTLNLNQLISDLLEVNRARRGEGGSRPAAPVEP